MQATAERHPRTKQNIVEYDFAQTRDYDMAAAAHEYKALQRQIESLKAQMDENKKIIIEGMAGREVVTAGAYKISYKPITSNRLDTDALKAVHPNIYRIFCKPSTSTRFTVD